MKLACNIDQRGRKARIVTGALVDAVGVALIGGGVFRSDLIIVAGIIALLVGSFMIFEGAAGWCVVRAMGFKTKI